MTQHRSPPAAADLARRSLPLDDGWTLRVDQDGPTPLPEQARALLGHAIPGRVPGAVHDDLLRAGLIPDPMIDDNEHAVAWVGRTDWVYERTLPPVSAIDGERVDVVFTGLDTVARVALDGRTLGSSRNMHRSYRYAIRPPADDDGPERRLAVHLGSAYTEAEALRTRVGPRPNAYPEPFNFIRKMACGFGWDWGPTLPGAGIWRPAFLETWSRARLAEVRIVAGVRGGSGTLRVDVGVERSHTGNGDPLSVEVVVDETTVMAGTLPSGRGAVTLTGEVPGARRWHPVGHGDAALATARVLLRDADGRLLDTQWRRIGFRTAALDRSSDDAGTRFAIVVNDDPVLVKGVNWIPLDVLPGRVTRERLEEMLRRVVDIGGNLVRVWGGGVYESDDFYELCDELGLLVWQDFPFACAAYPEDEPLRGEILAEAEENVARLASHPSLVVWNGNNENQWLRQAEEWTARPGGDLPWGERYYSADLPEVLGRVDPSRPYTPGSPWSGSDSLPPNDPAHQTHHSWDVWNRWDHRHYRDTRPRFVSEFGWQAPPAWRTLREAVTDEPMTPTSPGVAHHQKAAGGMDKLRRGLQPHAPVPTDFDAWHYLMQWNQVRAIETGILHWRAHWPHTTGAILWQLHDVWPALSWSAIDSAGRAKPLYHALRRLYADRALTIEPDGPGLVAVALNDSPQEWVGELVLRRISDAGVDLARRRVPVAVPPRGVQRLAVPPEVLDWDEPAAEVIVAELQGRRAHWYATEPIASSFVGAPPRLRVHPTDSGAQIEVTATTLLRDFLVQADRIDPAARADRGFLTLLPGESATVAVTGCGPLDPVAVRRPWVTSYLDGVLTEYR